MINLLLTFFFDVITLSIPTLCVISISLTDLFPQRSHQEQVSQPIPSFCYHCYCYHNYIIVIIFIIIITIIIIIIINIIILLLLLSLLSSLLLLLL